MNRVNSNPRKQTEASSQYHFLFACDVHVHRDCIVLRVYERKNYMISRDTKFSRRRLVMGLIATLAALCLLFVTTMGALADTVNISDKAGVLKNASQVQSEAANLGYPVNIYTMKNFTGTETAFN